MVALAPLIEVIGASYYSGELCDEQRSCPNCYIGDAFIPGSARSLSHAVKRRPIADALSRRA